jgi:D-3-phosphoglycerate dehydrogenase
MQNVLILDKVDPIFRRELQGLGFAVEEDFSSSAELIEWEKYQGLIIRSRMPVNSKILHKAKNLKFIARVGAGLENIDLEVSKKLGISVLAAPEGNRHAVGEQAIGMLLALFNRLLIADAEVRNGLWLREENRGVELKGKTVGIIGYGHMGTSFARKLRGFDCSILAYDKYREGFGNEWVEEVSLATLQAKADIISIHLPQNEETLFFIDETFIKACQKPIYLINTARGKLLKCSALVKALEEGKVLGAALDVLEYEKSSFEKLFDGNTPKDLRFLIQSDKVVLSPHIAGWSMESRTQMAEVLIHKIKGLKL